VKLFKSIGRFLTNRWFLSILGLAFVSAMIWFLGPLIAIAGAVPLLSPAARIITILLLVLVWAIISLLLLLKRQKTNKQVLTSLADSAPGPEPHSDASAEEIAALKERFDEAAQVLKKARLGGGRRLLYQLPWYVVIGPPGSGKTTLLKNCGLNFPLKDRFGDDAVRGVGGTRNCDWWFTDEAVLLDTAGRYTTQDSDQSVDKAAWGGFLSLLKRHRRRRPIDGVMVVFSLVDLCQLHPRERLAHARAVRARLKELYEHLKLRVPVYVMFTKADLLNGFVEFFGDLGREERAQVWGVTFSPGEAPLSQFDQQFQGLIDRLEERLLPALYQERDPGRRGAIHGFPAQMASLKAGLDEFLTEAFGSSRFEDTAMLRGVYFTSGTQQGTPIDRLIGAVSAHFRLPSAAMPAFSGRGRSYFVTRLLRDLVFRESDLVGSTGFFARNRHWMERGAYAGAGVATIVMAGLWINGYFANERYISRVEANIADYDAAADALVHGDRSALSARPYLDLLRQIPGGYADPGTPFLQGLGLSQRPKLGAAAEDAYLRALQGVLLPQVVQRLERQISAGADDKDFLFEALRIYLMLGAPSRYNEDAVLDWVLQDWAGLFPGEANREDREAILAHLRALLTHPFDPLPMDEALVAQARNELLALSQAQRVYGRLKWQGLRMGLPAFSPVAALGDTDSRLFNAGLGDAPATVPGLFTRDGYEKAVVGQLTLMVNLARQQSWVLGPAYERQSDTGDPRQLRLAVLDLYARDYERIWQHHLGGISVRPFRSFGDGAAVVQRLSGQSSPLVKLAVAVAEQTKLTGPRYTPPQSANPQGGLTGRVQSGLGRLLDAAAPDAAADPAARIDLAFQPLRDSLAGQGRAGTPLGQAMAQPLNDLYVHLSDLDALSGSGDAGLAAAADTDKTRGIMRRVELAADQQPEPIRRWLRDVVQQASALTLRDARGRVNQVWKDEILPFCRRAVTARFPMDLNSNEDVNLSDFTAFFGPQGMLDQFFQANLAPFVDTSVRPWQLKSTGGVRLGLSQQALAQFELADEIRRLFFANGASPSVRFDMRPLYLDRQAAQVQVQINDQRLIYQHGPQRLETVTWPGSGDTNRSTVTFATIGGGQSAGVATDGPWSWFRLLNRAKVAQVAGSDRYQVSFSAEGLRTVYELRAASVENPFDLDRLTRFRCVEEL